MLGTGAGGLGGNRQQSGGGGLQSSRRGIRPASVQHTTGESKFYVCVVFVSKDEDLCVYVFMSVFCVSEVVCSWCGYINTGGRKILVSASDVMINLDTMVLGRRLRISVISFFISFTTCTATGILFFPLHSIIYFLKLSQISVASVWPSLPL